ncbi:putative RNA-binding protein (consists of S1 domain and a Zn-ribbon domain) [Archaeoglobus sulfaticallidus PM70-1]|uniref:Exosome complex component Csl4 n=1 Tax=Archaeoglobus sulfaticallidus PM70-1 TaxID=387631 RepID=N0BJT4_9EURY|nr:exosome complex RNA-binding protein Csl4 [Archaeoglobus sulfaticallidus]AGK60761.1 putative RNA-binding protein (consists of S1 domain and a Zn-ribbon domain) [Archaeoglobus sulfaticallidus PM70-1]
MTKDFVFPGDKLGIAEEFICGEGVYEEDGELYASVAGKLVVKDRVLRVESVNKIPNIERGDTILGRVVDVRNSIALIELSRKSGFDRDLMHTGIAALHISNIQNEYLKDINSAVKYMDVVKARVIDPKLLKLSTKESDMGVVKAICSECRHELLKDGKVLKCPNCGNVERRKIASDYGSGKWE